MHNLAPHWDINLYINDDWRIIRDNIVEDHDYDSQDCWCHKSTSHYTIDTRYDFIHGTITVRGLVRNEMDHDTLFALSGHASIEAMMKEFLGRAEAPEEFIDRCKDFDVSEPTADMNDIKVQHVIWIPTLQAYLVQAEYAIQDGIKDDY